MMHVPHRAIGLESAWIKGCSRIARAATRLRRVRSLAPILLVLLWAGPVHAILPIQHWTTAAGAKVYFVESRGLPMLDVSVDFPAGSAYDSAEKAGLAGLTQALLRRGADGMTEDEVSGRFADVGAQLGGRFDSDRAGLSLRTLSSERERTVALETLARVLQQPAFPQAVLERERARILSGLREADTKPDTIGGRAFALLVFRDHPYALRGSGEIETLPRITREDLQRFHAARYTADRAVIAIMGDVSRADAGRIAEQLTSRLTRKGGSETLPAVPPLAKGEVRRIAHPASQSHILVGAPGIRRSDPDYFPLFVGNWVLGGGGFSSRLNAEVRQNRGLAYSVYSYFNPALREGGFQIGLQTRKDQADEALAIVRQTVRAFVKEGPTAAELDQAKSNIAGGFPLRIDSNRKILEYLAAIGFYDLPIDYLDNFVKRVEAVTVEDVRRAFRRTIDPDALVTVVVGAEPAAAGAGNDATGDAPRSDR
jgi:zinc protease